MKESPTIVERIGEWAAGLSPADIPPRVDRKLRLQILSTISAAAASPWHGPANAVLRARRGPGQALVFATGERIAAQDAAFVNSAFAMSLDFDDYLLTGHTGHSAVLVPLAFAETIDEALLAAACANEIMGRLSSMCFFGPLNGQMSSYIHNAGAAVAYAKVHGLSAERTASALALALYQPNFCLVPGFWEEGAKTVTASIPLEQGILAARLAQSGLSGPRDLFEHPLGFLSVFAFARFPGLMDGLGRVWFSDTLCYKRFPGTSYISAGVEGALLAGGGRHHTADEIRSVRIETTLLSSTIDSLGARAINRTPLDANAVNFSLRLSAAAALRFGDLTPDVLKPEVLAREEAEIRAIARKITVVHDWAQSLRLLRSTPIGVRMAAQLNFGEILRTAAHIRRMNRASGERGGNPNLYAGAGRELTACLRQWAANLRRPMSALDLDAPGFRMLQSARTTLETAQGCGTVMVDVPVGACGRDDQETEGIVYGKCRAAFGERAPGVIDAVMRPGRGVEDLFAAAGSSGG